MTPIQTFQRQIESFLETTGMTATAFGKNSLGDPNFVFDLRNGRVPNLVVVDRIQQFIRANGVVQSNGEQLVNGEAA